LLFDFSSSATGNVKIAPLNGTRSFWQNISGAGVADVLHSFFRSFMTERRPEAVGLDL
jgi:hypothetical protein